MFEPEGRVDMSLTVSYTHLDVYKRQDLYRVEETTQNLEDIYLGMVKETGL